MKKIVLALSGGVDSAVAVHLLQQEGYEVYAYTFLTGNDEEKREKICVDAKACADYFGISHRIEDIAEEFDATVISYFADAYFGAKTPNPCVYCNRRMKFPKLLAYADSLGIDKVATGHYVRMEQEHILRAKDKRKDQSYVLCLLPEALYSRFVFPLGEYTKPEIRKIAEDLGLPVAQKEDSQENCFIPNDDYKAFLRQYPDRFQAGNFLDTAENILGRHQGLPFYTIGQRRGLGLTFGTPKYVVRLDAEKNAVVIGDEKLLYANGCKIKDCNLIAAVGREFDCRLKIRYLSDTVPGHVSVSAEGKGEITFEEPQKAVTPGQFAVFYQGDMLLGGAEIDTVC